MCCCYMSDYPNNVVCRQKGTTVSISRYRAFSGKITDTAKYAIQCEVRSSKIQVVHNHTRPGPAGSHHATSRGPRLPSRRPRAHGPRPQPDGTRDTLGTEEWMELLSCVHASGRSRTPPQIGSTPEFTRLTRCIYRTTQETRAHMPTPLLMSAEAYPPSVRKL